MRDAEILKVWNEQEFSRDDKMSAFEMAGVPAEDIARLCGEDAATDYQHWVYYNVK